MNRYVTLVVPGSCTYAEYSGGQAYLAGLDDKPESSRKANAITGRHAFVTADPVSHHIGRLIVEWRRFLPREIPNGELRPRYLTCVLAIANREKVCGAVAGSDPIGKTSRSSRDDQRMCCRELVDLPGS